jgi:glutathione reductase (NADPH)
MLLRREILGPPMSQMSESKAREQGLKFRRKYEKASDWYTARRVAETVYGFKTLVEEDSERILGAHLVGHRRSDQSLCLSHPKGLTAEDLKATIFTYPTGASDVGYMV